MAELPPANIIIMEGYEAHMRAQKKHGRRLRYGAPFGAVVHAMARKKPSRAFFAQAPMRYLNSYAALPGGGEIKVPPSARIHFEMGLALRIGETVADPLCEDDGMDPIYGYAAAILLESPDFPGWGWLVLGPETDVEEFEDPYCRAVKAYVNNAQIGQGDTDGLTHSVAALVAQASAQTGVHEGEIIFTGAAAECSTAASNIMPEAGNTLRVEIDGLAAVQLLLK